MGYNAPDHVIIPTGAGSNILGCDLGFTELRDAGEIATLPKLWCAQPLLCSPIATAVQTAQGIDDGYTPRCGAGQPPPPADAWNSPAKTVAEGTSIARPVRLAECVDAVLRSGGGAVRVPEAALCGATLELAALGLYTEPTCAQAAAAYRTLVASGKIGAGETSVIVLTSTGVKATSAVASLLGVKA